MSTAHELAERYFAAWNAHDAAAIVATFAPGGTYEDPTTGGPLSGEAIGANAARLWATFPDLRFEIASHDDTATGAAAQWVMLGTNTAPFNGMPPTGKSVRLAGADFITFGPQGIESVKGYFDAGGVPRQLGLNIVVQPFTAGPFTFGTSNRVAGTSTAKPGAFSITSLRVRSAEEVEQVRAYSRQVAAELPGREGFLGFVGVTVADRMITITAWESPEHPRKMMKEGTHKDAMPAFFKHLSVGGWTSAWVPERINQHWLRCASCGQMEDAEKTRTCRCGAALPEVPSYF